MTFHIRGIFSEVCVPLNEVCVTFSEVCVPLNEVCVTFSEVCVPLNEVCVTFSEVLVSHFGQNRTKFPPHSNFF